MSQNAKHRWRPSYTGKDYGTMGGMYHPQCVKSSCNSLKLTLRNRLQQLHFMGWLNLPLCLKATNKLAK